MVKRNILHITSHMGGGVGNVLSSIATFAKDNKLSYTHKILILDKPEKMQFLNSCVNNGVEVIFTSDMNVIREEMLKADIIQLSWWHHPVMAKFLHEFPEIPIRLIIWFHVCGCNYPEIPYEFVRQSHKAFFTTKYTLDNPYWDREQRKYAQKNAEVIYGAGDLNHIRINKCIEHQCFNIGYIGTLNYSKLSPDFVELCSMVNVPDVKFILVGDAENQNIIEKEAEKYGVHDKLEFTGYTSDVSKELSRFDIFAYPLNPWHFGATENALLEAMAAGVPIVAMNQCAEKYLIQHMETGLLANSKEHYVQLIRYLYENPNERKRIGDNARNYVLSTFNVKNTVSKMNNVYESVINMEKRIFDFEHIFGSAPYMWFLACLGEDKNLFESSINEHIMADNQKRMQIEEDISKCHHILRERSKSSINHFEKYFPNDGKLKYWKNIIEKN